MQDPSSQTPGQQEAAARLEALYRQSGSRIPAQYLQELIHLPSSWKLCGVQGKRPVASEWNRPEQWMTIEALLQSNDCTGAGVLTGEASGGLLVVDLDEPSDPAQAGAAARRFQEFTGCSLTDLPTTAVSVSGRPGRAKIFLRVSHHFWALMKGQSVKFPDLELIWEAGNGRPRQAVIAGDHPDGQGWFYRWEATPAAVGVQDAPEWLIAAFFQHCWNRARKSEEDSKRAAEQLTAEFQPRPMDLLNPGQQRRLLRDMSAFWPYRGGKAGTDKAGTYSVISRLVLSVARGIDHLPTLEAWLTPTDWNRKSDWDGSGGSRAVAGGSLIGLAKSLLTSDTDAAEKVQPWSAAWALAKENGWQPPTWALPPKEIANDLLSRMAKKKVDLLDALSEIDRCEDPVMRDLAKKDIAKSIGIRNDELAPLLMGIEMEKRQSLPKFLDELIEVVKPTRPLIKDLVAQGALTLLVSAGGAGKTGAIYNMAWSVAYGQKYAGAFEVEQGNALIIQCDENAGNLVSKVHQRMQVADPERRIRMEFSWTRGMIPELKQWIDEHQAKLVVMDSLAALIGGGGVRVNDAEIALPLYELNQVAQEMDVAIVMTHHLNRSGDSDKPIQRGQRPPRLTMREIFGSSYIVNGSSDILGLQKVEYEGGDDGSASCSMLLTVVKDRTGVSRRGDTYGLEGSVEDLSLTVVDLNMDPKGIEKRTSIRAKLVKDLQRRREDCAICTEELAGTLGSTPAYVQKALGELMQEGQVSVYRRKLRGMGRPKYVYWGAGG